MTIQELQQSIRKFRDDRNWKQFHNPKDLAISVSLEAAELLEIFQWSGADLQALDKRDQLMEELADVMIYCFLLADSVDADVTGIITEKLRKNNEKYPVEKAFGRSDKYTELDREE